jgi:RNA polymerase sigma-70 factor (ECF subfamily)
VEKYNHNVNVIDERVAAARRAWPDFDVPDFAALLATCSPGELEALHVEDLYLARAVLAGLAPAMAAFESAYVARTKQYVVRITVDESQIDEIAQRLRERLLVGPEPKLAEYAGRGPLGGWVRMCAVRLALNAQRGRRHDDLGDDEPSLVLDPELALVKASSQKLFQEAFAAVLANLEPKQRTLLRLHYVEGMTMDQLARMFQTSRSSIARRVDEVRVRILEATAARLRDEHHLSPSEVQSMIASAGSRMQLTLGKILPASK